MRYRGIKLSTISYKLFKIFSLIEIMSYFLVLSIKLTDSPERPGVSHHLTDFNMGWSKSPKVINSNLSNTLQSYLIDSDQK